MLEILITFNKYYFFPSHCLCSRLHALTIWTFQQNSEKKRKNQQQQNEQRRRRTIIFTLGTVEKKINTTIMRYFGKQNDNETNGNENGEEERNKKKNTHE
jgi:hypothetical protein